LSSAVCGLTLLASLISIQTSVYVITLLPALWSQAAFRIIQKYLNCQYAVTPIVVTMVLGVCLKLFCESPVSPSPTSPHRRSSEHDPPSRDQCRIHWSCDININHTHYYVTYPFPLVSKSRRLSSVSLIPQHKSLISWQPPERVSFNPRS
jgi:hypothetical protein